jgi:hypothetical protein
MSSYSTAINHRFELRNTKLFNLLRLIFVPLEFFIVAFAITQSLDANPWWIVGLALYTFWLIYNSGLIQALISLGISSLLAIAYMLGGWIWLVIAFIVIVILYEVYTKITTSQG